MKIFVYVVEGVKNYQGRFEILGIYSTKSAAAISYYKHQKQKSINGQINASICCKV